MKRRQFVLGAGVAATAWASSGCSSSLSSPQTRPDAQTPAFEQAVQRIEAGSGGRLGVALFDTQSGAHFAWRGTERFPMTSTFKLLATAQVLSRVDQGLEVLSRRVAVQPSDIVAYAPVTGPRVGGLPMTLAELCEAAVTLSDNTAGNLLLRSFGGPAGLTAYARSLGDAVTRLDRVETALNEATPGDLRDTTTPHAMLGNVQQILLGDALSPASREQLIRWLLANKTGDRKLRARLPADWRVADKTGGGGHGSNSDVGMLWPPGRKPVIVSCYLTQTAATPDVRDSAIAQVGELAALLVAGRS